MVALAAALALASAQPTSKYFLGAAGDSCTQTCLKNGMNCNPAIQTNNSTALFQALGVTCVADARCVRIWELQPGGQLGHHAKRTRLSSLGGRPAHHTFPCTLAFPVVGLTHSTRGAWWHGAWSVVVLWWCGSTLTLAWCGVRCGVVLCGVECSPWWASDQPSYISNSSDPNYGRCLGWCVAWGGVCVWGWGVGGEGSLAQV